MNHPVPFESEYPMAALILQSFYRSGRYWFRYSTITKRWDYYPLPESIEL